MAAAGIALIALNSRVDLLTWISIIIGAMLIVPSLFALAMALFTKPAPGDRGVSTSTIIASIAGVGLGLAMILTPNTFAGLFVYIFAAILIVAGFFHIYIVWSLSRPVRLPWFCYLIPALMIVAGFVIMLTSLKTINQVAVIITGVFLILSAVNSFMEVGYARQLSK